MKLSDWLGGMFWCERCWEFVWVSCWYVFKPENNGWNDKLRIKSLPEGNQTILFFMYPWVIVPSIFCFLYHLLWSHAVIVSAVCLGFDASCVPNPPGTVLSLVETDAYYLLVAVLIAAPTDREDIVPAPSPAQLCSYGAWPSLCGGDRNFTPATLDAQIRAIMITVSDNN